MYVYMHLYRGTDKRRDLRRGSACGDPMMPAVLLGGIGSVLVALLWMTLFPALRRVERLE